MEKNVFLRKRKEELLRQEDPARHCRIAELAAIIAFHGEIVRLSTKKIYSQVICGK